MLDWVLLVLFIFFIIWKFVYDKLIYFIKCYFFFWCILNCYSNKCDVRVWWFYYFVLMWYMLSVWNRRIEVILFCLILFVCGINREMNGWVMRCGGLIKFVVLIFVYWCDYVVVCGRWVGWIWIYGYYGLKIMFVLNLVVNDLIKVFLYVFWLIFVFCMSYVYKIDIL